MKLFTLHVGCAILFSLVGAANAGDLNNKPNIVFFLADDMGLGDTSAYQDLTGNPDHFQLDTPNLERLASMGVRFTDAHSGAAVCTPTRLSLLTGTHSFRSPIKQETNFIGFDKVSSLLPGTRMTFATMLKNQGYRSYGVGKWHSGLQVNYTNHSISEGPMQAGFDHYTGTPGNAPGAQGIIRDGHLVTFDVNYRLIPFVDSSAIPWKPWTPGRPAGNVDVTRGIQQTSLTAAQAYLSDHVANYPDKPFLLYYASHANHGPFVGPEALNGRPIDGFTKAGGYLNVPTMTNDQGKIVTTGPNYGKVKAARNWSHYLQVDAQGNVVRHGPGERLKLVDENDVVMGVLLDYLEETDDPRSPGHKLIDNTLVIFTSDNGSDMGSRPSVGALPQSSDGVITDIKGMKSRPYEGGTRIPFIAAWAGKMPPGGTSNALFGLNDIYATFAAIAGHDLDATEAVDSENILAAFSGEGVGDFRDTRLVYKARHLLIIRDGDMKLIARDPNSNTDNKSRFDGNLDFQDLEVEHFFDLSIDGGETNDLKNDPVFATRIQTMLATLQTYVDQGYTRAGASQIPNGQNFLGSGSILSAKGYRYYGMGSQFEPAVLVTSNPSFIFRDGVANKRVNKAWLIQGNGVVTFNGAHAGLDNGSTYEVRAGTMKAGHSFQVNDASSLQLTGGDIDLTGQVLHLYKGDGLVEIRRGSISAYRLDFGGESSTAGEKILRFLPGVGGTVTLIDSTPIRFGTDGSPTDDYIDFVTASRGELATHADQIFYEELWQLGQLRVDGLTSDTLPLGFDEYFSFNAAEEGFNSLSLIITPEASTGMRWIVGLLCWFLVLTGCYVMSRKYLRKSEIH